MRQLSKYTGHKDTEEETQREQEQGATYSFGDIEAKGGVGKCHTICIRDRITLSATVTGSVIAGRITLVLHEGSGVEIDPVRGIVVAAATEL